MVIVSLSILNVDFNKLDEFLSRVYFAPVLHMDIMDGKFVTNVSFDEKLVKKAALLNPRSIIDVHLMCDKPEELFEKYKDAYADYITFHYETGKVEENIDKIHKLGLKAGLSIKPNTDIHVLDPYLDKIDYILIMSVEPGLGGQGFLSSSIEKAKYLKEYKEKNSLHYIISIDGGINKDTINYVKDYIDYAVIGSAITKSEYPERALAEYLKL